MTLSKRCWARTTLILLTLRASANGPGHDSLESSSAPAPALALPLERLDAEEALLRSGRAKCAPRVRATCDRGTPGMGVGGSNRS